MPLTPVFCCGFECGLLGSVGEHWSLTGTGSINTNASFVRSGARSGRTNPTAGGAIIASFVIGATGMWVIRGYVYFTTLPNATCPILITSSGDRLGAFFNSSDSKIYAGTSSAALGATGVAVTTGIFYRIDIRANSTANPWLVDVQVNGIACGQASNAVAAVSPTGIVCGSSETITADIYFDDIIASNTSADYPLGAGVVRHFVGTSDGTHTSTGTTTVKGTIAAPTAGGAITSATTDAFNWVNGVPLLGGATDNTRLINQQTAASTLYAEVVFGPAPGISTPTVAPRAVEVITADRQASTAVGDFTVKLNDNGTENNVVARGAVAGVITDRYARKHYALAPTGGAWTVVSGAGNFNNIRARFGYAADATPDQYWRGIMIEAEFASIIPNKIVNINQAVKRAAYW